MGRRKTDEESVREILDDFTEECLRAWFVEFRGKIYPKSKEWRQYGLNEAFEIWKDDRIRFMEMHEYDEPTVSTVEGTPPTVNTVEPAQLSFF